MPRETFKRHIFVGIDPGLTGAIAKLSDEGCVEILDMPVRERRTQAKDGMINEAALVDIFQHLHHLEHIPNAHTTYWHADTRSTTRSDKLPYCDLHRNVTVAIERQQAFPGQGVSSTFKTGRIYGTIIGAACAVGLSVILVAARNWKDHSGIAAGEDKDSSRRACKELFPEQHAQWLKRKKDHGRADALLLAAYARDNHSSAVQ